MTYTELIKNVSSESEYPYGVVEDMCKILFEEIAKGLARDKKVKITRFCTMTLEERRARKIYDVNAKTVRISPPHNVIAQKYSKMFEDVALGMECEDGTNNVCEEDE